MKTRIRTIRIAMLALVLLVLGMMMVTAQGAGLDRSSIQAEPVLDSAPENSACYTIDTSRPEWMRSVIYLPVITKGVEA